MESFAFFLVECRIERDGLARERYFLVVSEIDLIGLYFYRTGISAEQQLSISIPLASCATFHQ